MSVIDRRKNVRLAHREFALQIIEDGNGNDVSETDLRMIQSQLKEKQKKLDKLDDEILGLISEEGEADDCVKEGKEAGQFRSKVQAAIIQIQGRLDDKLQRSVLRNELEVRESHVSILKLNLAGSSGMQSMIASGKGKDWEIHEFIGLHDFSCGECGKEFKSKKGLNMHLAKTHGNTSNIAIEEEQSYISDIDFSTLLTKVLHKVTAEEIFPEEIRKAFPTALPGNLCGVLSVLAQKFFGYKK
eukprot:gene15962-7294_t